MNNPFVLRQSEELAQLLKATRESVDEQVKRAVEMAYGQSASPQQVQALRAYAVRHGLANLCRLIFNSNEFLFVN
jgi:hypothetical protein